MNLKEIHELVKIINKSNVSEISIEMKDFKITLKAKGDEGEDAKMGAQPQIAVPVQQQPVRDLQQNEEALPQADETEIKEPTGDSPDESNYITIKSPMIGTFYRAPGPDKDPYVKVGDQINPGDVICTIEAMKLFNEIEAEVSGKIVKVLVENATPIEYDQPIFLVDPTGS